MAALGGIGFLLLCISLIVLLVALFKKNPALKSKALKGLGLGFVLFIVGAVMGGGSGGSSPSEEDNFLKQNSKPNQIEIHTALKGFVKEYKDGKNEVQKSAVFRKKREYLVKAIPDGKITNWIGEVDLIGTTKGGDYANLEIESRVAGQKIAYKTWNNRLSDVMDNTMIPMNSPIYQKIGNLKQGDKVVFTAQMIKDKQDGFREGSMTEEGNMTDTEFIVKFVDIKKLDDVLKKPAK